MGLFTLFFVLTAYYVHIFHARLVYCTVDGDWAGGDNVRIQQLEQSWVVDLRLDMSTVWPLLPKRLAAGGFIDVIPVLCSQVRSPAFSCSGIILSSLAINRIAGCERVPDGRQFVWFQPSAVHCKCWRAAHAVPVRPERIAV